MKNSEVTFKVSSPTLRIKWNEFELKLAFYMKIIGLELFTVNRSPTLKREQNFSPVMSQ